MIAADAIHAARFNGEPALPSTPPTTTRRAPVRTRRRVQPSEIRLAVATMSINIVIRSINAATGDVAAESSGTNAAAPAYEGHIGPLPRIALRTIAPAAAAPS